MEEKDIKELWKKGEELDTEKYSKTTIEKIIQNKPKDIISKFLKTLKIELLLNLAAFTLLSLYLIYEQFWLEAIGIFLFNILLYKYYKKLINDISKESIDIGVADYLCNVYKSIQRFILHYKILLVVISVPAYFFGIYTSNPDVFSDKEIYLSLEFILLILVGLAVAVSLGYSILYIMYGKKANKIKQMVSLLEKEEAD